jgi:endonuclease III
MNGHAAEIGWQEDIIFDHITETDFLRETAWVILSSGMKESVIRRKFNEISEVFYQWESAFLIVNNRDRCMTKALNLFNNNKKISAIIEICEQVNLRGFFEIKKSVAEQGTNYLLQFPFLGPATSLHLAKNIGLPVAKPDRHLIRIVNAVGYNSPQDMCSDIALLTGEEIAVIDLVLWRYATLNTDYLELFRNSDVDSENSNIENYRALV